MVLDFAIHYEKAEFFGDMNFDLIMQKTNYVNPVPRGIGSNNVKILIKNLLKA